MSAAASDRARAGAARALLFDVALLCAAKLLVDAWLLRAGFTHVSDDDYARTVIAEQFAHAPRLDPSGTSWLPFPFWVAGAAMRVAGRSLGAARQIAVLLGAAAVAAPYLAMRAARVPRVAAIGATAIAMSLPWSAWLGAATVPDGWAGALLASAMIGLGAPAARGWASAALLAAALSRYEAWPVCAVFALACVAPRGAAASARRLPGRDLAWAIVAAIGPALWMAWNAHAHGSALHFVARVSTFRRAIGAADVPLRDKLLGYPRALLLDAPVEAILGAVGLAGFVESRDLRRRWLWPLVCAAAVVAFLVAGDLGDGAPTHHPARALVSLFWVFTGMGVDAAHAIATGPSRGLRAFGRAVAGAACLSLAVWLPSRLRSFPGASESERRDAQVARGLALRASAPAGTLDITPCQFEHFALLAAWGEPERARIGPRTKEPVTSSCPRIAPP